MELLRFVNSGTEAVMSAVRVARGATGRPKVVKFSGGYHGHSDGLLARAGSGVASQALPDSAGVPLGIAAETLVVPYNDIPALTQLFDRAGGSIAAVVVEPVAGNIGLVPPRPGFLKAITTLAHRAGSLVIADEVITGFRLRRGAIHQKLGLGADLVTLGKVIGGGMPVAAYGGRQAVMENLAPLGPVYQAGTLSGNPVAMAAGIATLDVLTSARYRELERMSARLGRTLSTLAKNAGVEPFTLQRVGSMLGLFFAPGPLTNAEEAALTDRGRYSRFFHTALDGGVYLPPSPLETTFVSMAVDNEDVDRASAAFAAAFRAAQDGGP
jgi:glutamate-1-semialdehyde 2,1-aminomutase